MKKKLDSPVGVGAVSVFTILLVLTLAVFSVLTFSTARADLTLSRINADTVSAYYSADAQAVRLLEKFQDGTEPELEETIPINESQNLYIHFIRNMGNDVQIEAWKTESAISQESEESTLPVYRGVENIG